MARTTTLAEVAERVGVSARTVSRVVNREGGFSEATRVRVETAIAEAGYRPNLRARSLVTNRSGTIGLVVTFLTDPYFPDLAESVGAALAANGQTMLLASNHDNVTEQTQVVESMISHGVDGIIIFPASSDLSPAIEAADLGIPVVVVDHEAEHPRIGTVLNDIKGGARRATQHLIDRDHTSIGMVTNVGGLDGGRSWREDTFRSVMSQAGLKGDDSISHTAPTTAGGYEATLELLGENSDISAIFAYNDLMAVGVLRAANELGRRVPIDLAVVGFDDIDIASVVSPPLTTVRLDRENVGRSAADMLNRMIEDRDLEPVSEVIPTTLVERESA